jgi:hypothetical protein
LALKQLADLALEAHPDVTVAYWDKNSRRDAAPLLDKLAASIDHVEPFARGGLHDSSNFAAVCARCNARKSTKTAAAFLTESQPWQAKGKHGEPVAWDGMAAVYVLLARQRVEKLSAAEREWLEAIETHLVSAPRPRAV